MSFILANFLGNGNNSNDSSAQEDKQLIIEKLTAKMINSAHLEDRKAAAQTIKSLARSHRLEIGTLALQALIDELRRDLEDEELAKIVLETLDILCSSSTSSSSGSSVDVINSDGIEVQFCEILLKNEQNVSLLLQMMGDSDDFYLRFTSIQILLSLCSSQPFQLKSAVLNSPAGVSKVLDLLKDAREIVRNEGLLLCGALVKGNADLQKILGFQGAFEQVMQIIVEEEGPWRGPLIIQDAFNLISGMLNLNTANQTYFRDSICFKQLAGLIALPDSSDEDNLWNRTRISNYLAALSVLDGLLCKSNVDLEASQNSALKTHFLRPLLALAFTPKVPVEVSASALNCLSGLIWCNNRAQQEFSKEKLTQSPLTTSFRVDLPISPIMGAIILTLHSQNQTQEGLAQRLKALELLEAFCSCNPEGQLILLSTLKSTTESSASPGSVILEALFDLDLSRKRDPWHCWFASALLCHLINGNVDAKRALLKHQIAPDDDEEESEDILTVLMLSLIRSARDSRGSTCQKSIIGYLQLLLIWFHEFPEGINRFLQEGSFVQYLIERITHQSFAQDTQIQGLSALILGICVLFNDESIKNFGSEGLKGIIKNRIGPDLFISKLSHLKSERDEIISELTSAILVKNYENLMNLVARPTPAGTRASHTATLAQLTKDLSECRSLLTDTQSHLSQSGRLIETLKIGISERDAYILQLQKLISEKNQKIAQMAHELSNLEQQQQQQQQQQQRFPLTSDSQHCDQEALKSLKETIKQFQETVARQQARIQELEALLSGHNNSELEKWKDAYHKLYEQVQQQLNFNLSEKAESVNNEKMDEAEGTVFINKEDPSEFENVTVTSAFCPTEKITFTSAFCPEEEQAPQSKELEVEVLSPSMFMSPLVEDEQTVVVSETAPTSETSPELVSLNQLPEIDRVNAEYPELNDNFNTSFNAAVIVSEEFAKNNPNPLEDEPVIPTISSECPPDNFLSSDEDAVEIVSKEEIRNVLDFFDKLPQQELDSVTSSSGVKSIQEGLDALHVTEEKESDAHEDSNNFDFGSSENNFNFGSAANTQEIVNEPVTFGSQEENVPRQQPEDFSQQIADPQYNADYYGGSYDQTAESIECIQPDFSHPNQDQSVFYPESQQEQYYTEYDQPQPSNTTQTQEVNFAPEQAQEHYVAEVATSNDQISFEQTYDSSTAIHDQSQDFTSNYDQSYYSENTNDQQPQEYNYDSSFAQSQTLDGHVQQSQDFTESTNCSLQQSQEFTQAPQGHNIQDNMDYNSAQQSQDYSVQGSQDYMAQDSNAEAQNYNTHPSQDYIATEGYSQPSDYTQSATEYSTVPASDYYNSDYQAEATNYSYYEQTEQGQEASNVAAVDQSYQSYYEYNGTSAYEQPQTQDQVAYEQSTQAYDQVQYQDQLQSQEPSHKQYDQSSSYQDESQAAYTTTESQDQSQSEYYYYDESTGFTYGFDQNVNQYYYYDPNTGEYTYYTAEVTQDVSSAQDASYTQDASYAQDTSYSQDPYAQKTSYAQDPAYTQEYSYDQGGQVVYPQDATESVASSNPSLFDNAGPPMIPLQQHQASSLSTNNFASDQQIYNL